MKRTRRFPHRGWRLLRAAGLVFLSVCLAVSGGCKKAATSAGTSGGNTGTTGDRPTDTQKDTGRQVGKTRETGKSRILSGGDRAKRQNDLRQIGLAYHSCLEGSGGKSPAKPEDLAPHFENDAKLLAALKDKEIIFVYNAPPLTQMTAGTSQNTTLGSGLQGLTTTLRSNSVYGGNEIDTLVTVVRGQKLWYVVFIAPERDADRVQATFQQMLDSVSFQ